MLPDEENRILSAAGMMKQWLEGPRRKFLVTVPVGKFGTCYSSMYSVSMAHFLLFSDASLDQSQRNQSRQLYM